MSWVRGLGRFVWDFVVGDDPKIALGVVIALFVTLVLSDYHEEAWWLLPIVVAGMLLASVLGAFVGRSRNDL